MKVIIFGGTGTIGQAIVKELEQRHEIITVGHKHGDHQVDLKDIESVKNFFQQVGEFDAAIVAAGKVLFRPLTDFSPDKYLVGINDKLMGQINVVLAGLSLINDGGSFTLTSGILSIDPVRNSTSGAMVNGAIDAFVRSAAIEMPRQIRINAVSPTLVTESQEAYGASFRGYEPVSAARVAMAFSKSVEGAQTGRVFKAGYY